MSNILRLLGDDRLAVREIVKPSAVAIPDAVQRKSDGPWECEVVLASEKLTEPIKVGDRLLVGKTGDQTANHNGEVLRVIPVGAAIASFNDESSDRESKARSGQDVTD